MGVDALQLLHRLSSNPDSAGDALKLLHELQVHQVELDLQNQEIAANERRLTEELDLYRGLFDAAPLGYLLVDRQELVIRGNVPPHSGMAYIVVQHLDPTHETLLSALLQRVTDMPVHDARQDMPIEPDSVYIISPNTELRVSNGKPQVDSPAEPRGMQLPIDILFSSLAGALLVSAPSP